MDFLAGNKKAVPNELRDRFALAYSRPEALKAGFDWYRSLSADAKHNAEHKNFDTPLLYLRGDADGRKVDDYVAPLKKAGARNVRGETWLR